jgi:hypothetical protein
MLHLERDVVSVLVRAGGPGRARRGRTAARRSRRTAPGRGRRGPARSRVARGRRGPPGRRRAAHRARGATARLGGAVELDHREELPDLRSGSFSRTSWAPSSSASARARASSRPFDRSAPSGVGGRCPQPRRPSPSRRSARCRRTPQPSAGSGRRRAAPALSPRNARRSPPSSGEALAHRVDELVEIGDELLDGHRRSRDVAAKRLAGAALIPVDDREDPLERRVEVAEERRLAQPRPPVQEDQRRVGDALATDHHPLIEPAEPAIRDLGDAAGHELTVWPAERRRPSQVPHALASVSLLSGHENPGPGGSVRARA